MLYRLKNAGFQAYLVGGGVRDLLLGREPKDFDIATDALPDEVRKLFRNCRLIGRRFRLAHIIFGREIIEVATFRAQANDAGEGGIEQEENGRLLRDNVYGNLEQDAWRRDFTINALYYNIEDFSVVDYTGGMDDIEAGLLRVIGDPEQRFREDPVRMLRAVRFAAKIGFRVDEASEAKIYELGHLLQGIPAARLFDEVLKLFLGGYALQTFELLRHYDLFEHLFPATEAALAQEENHFPLTLVTRALANTDERIAQGKPVTPAFLYAALLWEPVRQQGLRLQAEGVAEQQAFNRAAQAVIAQQLQSTSLPRRFSTPMQEIWIMQPRLAKRAGKRAWRLFEHPRFRAAYDFLLLCAEAGEADREVAEWWTRFQEVDEDERAAMVRKLTPKRARRGRRPRKQTPSE
ncbi:poly(A) polymerase [Candidatus Tenderia electrophaga]|uniref:Poly(A) polymerase I n=1 Tax=Candidatus Tenderia electrophaga TaxID=1748243 RepID=A0A0S2TBG0_9GAMM|nr:poly(A) polymerase [Candidatus Tenderia electrophaga]